MNTPKLPTIKPRVTAEIPRVNMLPPPSYNQQPAYTSTNPTNHSDIFKIKPFYNHKYPTCSNKKLNINKRVQHQTGI